jgi:hypothetical protein
MQSVVVLDSSLCLVALGVTHGYSCSPGLLVVSSGPQQLICHFR